MLVDAQRILAEQVGRHCLVDVSLNRLGPEEGLAETDQLFVGMDLHKQDVRELVESQRLYLGNLHNVVSPKGSYVKKQTKLWVSSSTLYTAASPRRSASIFSRLRPLVSTTKDQTKKKAATPMKAYPRNNQPRSEEHTSE